MSRDDLSDHNGTPKGAIVPLLADVISREVGGVSMCSHSQRVLPYINHIGMYWPQRVGVCAVLV